MADENPDAPAKDAKPSRLAFPGGWIGWVIVFAVAIIQAAVFSFYIFYSEPDSAGDPEQTRVFLEDPAILQSRVQLDNFSSTIPGPGGDLRPLNFNLVMEMHYLPEEKRPGAARPTLAQIEVFRTVVVQLESKIRDHLNTFLTGRSFTDLVGERGPELVKAELMRFVNSELERYDFAAMSIPENISRRRVTNVLLPSWTLM